MYLFHILFYNLNNSQIICKVRNSTKWLESVLIVGFESVVRKFKFLLRFESPLSEFESSLNEV